MTRIGGFPDYFEISIKSEFLTFLTVTVIAGAIIFLVIVVMKRLKKNNLPIPISPAEPVNETTSNSCNFESITGDERLFIYTSDKRFSIRVIENAKDKDKIVFATSLSHKFSDKVKKDLLLAVPQIIDVEVLNSHELRIHKSPAVYLTDIQEDILLFLFKNLIKEGK